MSLNVGRLTAEIGLDGTQDIRNDLRRLEQEFRDFSRSAERTGDQTRRSFDGAGRGLDDLGTAGRRAAGDIDAAGRDMRNSIDQVERDSQRAGQGIRDNLGQAGEQGGNRLRDGLRGALDGAAEEFQGAGEGMGGGVVGGITARLAGAGGPVGAAVAAALAVQVGIPLTAGAKLADQVLAGFEAQATRGQIKAEFGWTEAQAAEAGAAASGAYVNAWGTSQAENMRVAGAAIQAGLLDGTSTASEMQPVIEQLQIVSTLMGEEIPEVARAAGQMVKTDMAGNITEAFDLLTVGQQKGLNLSGDLIDTMVEYAVQFEKLGIDGATALGTISQMSKAGARDTDLAADALKEFSIRTRDGSDATKEAYGALKLNADETTAAFAKGGESALGMSRVVLTALAQIKDPVERERLGIALLGTQWEDLGPAIEGLDLAAASKEMKDFGGATKRAGEDMSGASSGIEGMKRAIDTAVSSMQSGLADAFAPMATDIAKWVTENQDEIVGFFTEVGKYAGMTAGATIHFTGAFISGLGYVVKYLGDAGGFILGTFADIMGGIGRVVQAIPGMEGIGQTLIEGADTADGMAQKLFGAGDSMISFGHKVKDAGYEVAELSAKIGELPPNTQLTVNAPGGQEVLAMLKEMGAKVRVDNHKNIVVESPLAPDVIAQLEKIGIAVRTDNNKTVLVVAETGAAQTALDTFISQNSNRRIINVQALVQPIMDPNYTPAPPAQFPAGFPKSWSNTPGPAKPQPRATGGPIYGPGSKTSDDVLIAASTGEFMQQAAAVDYYGLDFMHAVNQRRIPKDLIPHLAGGGSVLDSLIAIQRQVAPGLQMTSGVRSEPGSFHNTGQAGDFSNGSSNTPEMLSFARYMAANYGAALAELIYHDPAFSGQQVDEGKIVPDSFFAGAGDHTNHVHLAAHNPLPLPSAAPAPAPQAAPQGGVMTVPLIQKPDGTWTSPDPAWAALIARESGGNPTIVQGVSDANSGGNEATGLFQIARGTWSSNGGEEFAPEARMATPQQQAIVAARIFEKSGGQPWGAGLPGRENEDAMRAGLVSTAPSPPGAMPGAPSGTPGATDYSSTSTTTASRGEPPEDPSVATFKFTNPLKPWWWSGEEQYRDRIISDYEKQQKWDEYWRNGGESGGDASKGKKVTVKSIEEATKDLEDAKADLAITLQRQREQKPDAPQSTKMSMQKSVDDANEKVAEAQRELEQAKANPQGFYYEPEAGAVPGGLPGPAKRMAAGGTIPGVGNTDSVHILGMPGEEIIRKDIAEQPGMRQFLKAINSGAVSLPGYADGGTVGFGGYTHDTSDVMAPKNWRDWMGLATGAGFMAYNLAEPYVNAAVTGKVDLGNITPQLNTGTTDTSMVTSTLSAAAGQLSGQLDEIIWALKEGKNITVKIDGFNDPFNGPQIAARRH